MRKILRGGGRSAEMTLWIDDVDGRYEPALQAGGEALRPPMDGPDGRLRYARVLDPEGRQVKLLRKRGRVEQGRSRLLLA